MSSGINAFYANTLRAPLRSPYSWGSYDAEKNRVFLSVWDTEIKAFSAYVGIGDESPSAFASKERLALLSRVREGASLYLVVIRGKNGSEDRITSITKDRVFVAELTSEDTARIASVVYTRDL